MAGPTGARRLLRTIPRIPSPVLVVAAAAALLALRELDGFLGQLQHEGHGTYTTHDLAPLVPRELVEHVRGVLDVWKEHRDTASTAVNWHLGVDTFVFVPVYAALLAGLLCRALGSLDGAEGTEELRALGSRWRIPLIGIVVADLLENATRAAMIWTDETPWLLIHAAWLSTWLKWAFAALVLVLLTALGVRARTAPRKVAESAEADPKPDHAPWRLRVPLVLVGIWALFLLFDPSGQIHDLVRRWFDGGALRAQGAGTLLAAGALGLASWTVARRILFVRGESVVDPDTEAEREKELSLPLLAFIAALAGCVAYGASLENLGGTAIVFGLLFALSAIAALPTPERASGTAKRKETARTVDGTEATSARRLAWGLAVAPPVVLLLTLGTAMVVPAVVLSTRPMRSTPSGGAATAVAILAPVAALMLTALAVRWWPAVCARWRRPRDVELRHVAAALAALAVAAAAIAWRAEVPPALGSITIVIAALVLVMLVLGEGQRYGESHRPPAILGALGFVRVPVAAIAAAVFAVSSLLDQGGYHDVRLTGVRTPSPQGVDLVDAWESWKLANCVATANQPVPLLLVASHGGGIRAAYWTGSVLTELLGAPAADTGCIRARTTDRVFALAPPEWPPRDDSRPPDPSS